MDRQEHLEKCKSKKWFETEAEAEKAAKRIEVRVGVNFYTYHCPFCRLYHITRKQYSLTKHLNLLREEMEYQERAKLDRPAKT